MKNTLFTPWLKVFEPQTDASVRLFCFSYAGCGASIFRTWSSYFPTTVEICGVQLPGRETRLSEKPFCCLKPLVRNIAEALHPFLNQPFAFFGHSMGALISFALSRYLRNCYGRIPIYLFVSGHRAPQIPNLGPIIHALPEPEFMEELRSFNGTPQILLKSSELMAFMVPLLRADFEVCETFIYNHEPPLKCPLAVFGGLQDYRVGRDHLEAWRDQTDADFSLHMFPGDHFFLNSIQPVLLQIIRQKIDASVGAGPTLEQ